MLCIVSFFDLFTVFDSKFILCDLLWVCIVYNFLPLYFWSLYLYLRIEFLVGNRKLDLDFKKLICPLYIFYLGSLIHLVKVRSGDTFLSFDQLFLIDLSIPCSLPPVLLIFEMWWFSYLLRSDSLSLSCAPLLLSVILSHVFDGCHPSFHF